MIKSLLKVRMVLKLNRKDIKGYVFDIKAGDVINDEEILVEIFTNHYVNIVVNPTGVTPLN